MLISSFLPPHQLPISVSNNDKKQFLGKANLWLNKNVEVNEWICGCRGKKEEESSSQKEDNLEVTDSVKNERNDL